MYIRFEQLGRVEDSEEAIKYYRESLALLPRGHPERLSSLYILARAVSIRFRQSGRIEELEEAITCHREALGLVPHGHPDRSSFLFYLANALSTRFGQSGRMEDLEEAIRCHREALALRPLGHPERPSSLSNLANAVSTRFGQLGRMEDLEEPLTCYREALTLLPHGHPNRPSFLCNFAITLYITANHLHSVLMAIPIAHCLSITSQMPYPLALNSPPPSGPSRTLIVSQWLRKCHVHSLWAVWKDGGFGGGDHMSPPSTYSRSSWTSSSLIFSQQPRNCSVHTLWAVGQDGGLGGGDRISPNLANAVYTRFGQSGRMEDLEEAIRCHRESLALRPHGHPDRSSSLSNLASAVSTRFGQSGVVEDLEEAITCYREALTLRPHGHPERSCSLSNLANAVSTRFEQLGRMEDLEEAIEYHRESLPLVPHGHPDRSSSLCNLANAMYTHFGQLGRMDDLEEAIEHHRESLALRPHRHPNRSSSLTSLGLAVYTRFGRAGRMEDLEEAIECHRESLPLVPHGHPDRSSSLGNLGIAVYTRFGQLGRMEDLEEAITCHREALALRPHRHPNRSLCLTNLGIAVYTRFEQLGRMEDLEEAIEYHRESLALLPHGHPNRSSCLISLGIALYTRFWQLGRTEDLEEAITYYRESLALHPHGHTNRSSSLNNLGIAVYTRFGQSGRMEDLEEAITCHREALALRPHGHPYRSSSLSNLASAMSTRFRQSASKDDLLDALKCHSEAKTILPTEHPDHATAGSKLACTLLMLYDIGPKSDENMSMMSEAFALFKHAANHTFASAKARFEAAVKWAQEARRRKHQSAVDAYAQSLILLDRCLVLAPTVESQQNFLAATNVVPKALALDAASSAIDAGEFGSAVELLEQGRAVLWSKLRGYRHPLDELRTIDEELADQFKALSSQLECLATSSELQPVESDGVKPITSVSFEAKMQRHRILSKDWDNIVRKIRQIDGFAGFLQAIPFATLQEAAAEGPVIIVNVSRYRSDAIILRDVGDPVLVPLSETLPIVLNQLSSQLTKACASHGKDSARQILPILRSLWGNIAFPVREQLVALGVPDKSRIWWCPTSDLCALPLHAAGAYSSKVAKPNTLPDCYISSYTSTLSALIRARSGVLSRATDPNLLIIAQPDDTLPEVEKEISRIRQIVNNVDILKGSEANHNTVLSSLRNHSWAHFACHGHLNNQPFYSSFQLHNHNHLALVDLIRAQLPDAELAFLSACHTAAGDMVGTPDEVIHLAAALQFCGFRSVVGTLWAMEDVDGCDVAKYFYRHMFRIPGAIPNFRDSAEALNLATREMRKSLGLDRWIKFVHIGA